MTRDRTIASAARDERRAARVRRILRGGATSEPIKVNDAPVRLRLLSQAHKDDAWIETCAAMTARGVEFSQAVADVFATEKILRLLTRAVLDAETGEPMATLEEWREYADTETVSRLWSEYQRFEAAAAPTEPVDLATFLEEARKYVGESEEGLSAFLKMLGYSELLSCATSMTRRLLN